MISCFKPGLILALTSSLAVVGGNIMGLRSEVDSTEDELDPSTQTHLCDYYNDQVDLSDGPCSSGSLDSKGACNTTQKCQEDSGCYMSWRNNSGLVTIVKSGCWLKDVDCMDKRECRATNNSALLTSGVFYCCCLGDFCNRNFYLDPTLAVDVPEKDLEEEEEGDSLIVLVLVPVAVFCLVIVLGWVLCKYLLCKTKNAKETNKGIIEEPMSVESCSTNHTCFQASSEIPSPELLEVKARGRFGKVWRAQLHDKIVAVKTFSLSEKSSWQNEQDIFCTPQMNTHANVLKFLTASNRGEGMNSELWLITEFYERGSLADYLKVHTLNLDEALRIMKTMASGMSFLHEDVVSPMHDNKPAIAHRDFKSKNVLLDHDLNAVIADFGLAVKFMPGESPGETHGQVGTLRYMAPEILEGAINFQKDAFLRIDMYAFGLVMWEILSRCTALEDCGEFRVAFEEELGSNPSIDLMQEHVVEKKQRPNLKKEWRKDKEISTICETIEECWDNDAEARLPAGCVELRVAGIQRQRGLTNGQTSLIVNMPPLAPGSLTSGIFSDTEVMNQRNLHMSALSSGNGKHLAQKSNGSQSTTLDGDQDPGFENNKIREDLFVDMSQDDDHDSGTFASEGTVSQDGAIEHLLAHESRQTLSEVVVLNGNSDSAALLLDSEECVSNL